MLILLSPAKTLDESPSALSLSSEPRMLDQTAILARQMRRYSPKTLAKTLGISDTLAELNSRRYQVFLEADTATKQALLLFKGDSYLELGLEAYNEDDYTFAQEHLRILSGLYGVLRPLDRVRPYRLDMGTRLRTRRGSNLRQFWGDRITNLLRADLAKQEEKVIVNLASAEYFNAVDTAALDVPVVHVRFEDRKGERWKVISFFAKRARGAMASHLIRGRASLDDVRSFQWGGYTYADAQSSETTLVFRRRGQ